MKRGVKWGALAAGTTFGALAALNLLAYRHAVTMTSFVCAEETTERPERLSAPGKLAVLLGGIRVVRPESSLRPSDVAPGCEALTLGSAPGPTLSAWFCSRGPQAPLVLLFHGYAQSKADLLPEARAFLELGASVLLVDFQGSGGSSGSDTTIGVREAGDVAAAVRFARARLPGARLLLYGQSMGAAAVLRAAGEGAVAPDAVIVEGVFDSLLNTVRNRFASMGVPSFPNAELLVFWGGVRHGYDGFAHRPAEYVRTLRCPLLVMHGSADKRVSVAEARRVFEAAPGRKAFKLFLGAGHESFVSRAPAEWREAVAPFLRAAGG